MTAGIVMTSAALPLALFAAYYSDTAKRECVEDQRAAGIPANNDCENARETRNVVIGIVALATIGVGIPLIVYGAKKVPSRAQAVLTPRVSQRGGEVSLHVTF